MISFAHIFYYDHFIFIIYFTCIYLCVCVHTFVVVQVWWLVNNAFESIGSFCLVDSSDFTQVIWQSASAISLAHNHFKHIIKLKVHS